MQNGSLVSKKADVEVTEKVRNTMDKSKGNTDVVEKVLKQEQMECREKSFRIMGSVIL